MVIAGFVWERTTEHSFDNNVVGGHAVAEDTLFQRMSSDEVIFALKIRHCLSLDIRE